MDEILVKIISEPSHTCIDKGPNIKSWPSCSNFKTKKSCNKGCGLSTGGARNVER